MFKLIFCNKLVRCYDVRKFYGSIIHRFVQNVIIPDKPADLSNSVLLMCAQCTKYDAFSYKLKQLSMYVYVSIFQVSPSLRPMEHGMSYYVLQCEGPGLPLAGVHSVGTHRLSRILYDTRPQRTARLRELALPTQRSFEVRNRVANSA